MPYQQIELHAFGGPEELHIPTVADVPEPQSGEVRIRVLVTSAAFTDVMIRKYGGTAIDSDVADLEAAIAVSVGDGVDAVFDPLGGDSFPRSLHALRPGGMLVAYGFMNEVLGRGGSIPLDFVKLKLWDCLPNRHATAFYSIGAMRRTHPEWFREDLATLFAMLAEGRFDPAVAEVVPLSEVRRAHQRVEAGEEHGKLVMRVTEA